MGRLENQMLVHKEINDYCIKEYRKKNPDVYRALQIITAITFASKNVGRTVIDKIFNLDKVRYINAYENIKLENCNSVKTLPFDIEVYTKKALGIMEDAINRNDFTNLELMYKPCYKKNYNEYKNIKKLEEEHILKILDENKDDNVIDTNNKVLTTMFIYSHLRPKFINLELIISGSIKNLLIEMSSFNIFKQNHFSKELLNEYKEQINTLKNEVGIKAEYCSVKDLFFKMVQKDVKDKDNQDRYLGVDNDVKIGRRGKYLMATDRYFDYLEVDTLELTRNTNISKKEIEELLLNVIYCFEDKLYDKEDGVLIFILYLKLYSLAKEYNNLKNRYIKDINEEYLLKVSSDKLKYQEALNEVSKLKESISIRETVIANKEMQLNEENNNLKRELSSMSKQLTEYETLKKEVSKLREVVFNKDIEDDDEENINTLSISDIMNINTLNVAIIGGNQNWIKKTKEVLNNWTFIGTDSVNTDFSFLKNKDLILINTKMSHSLYYKVKGLLDRFNLNYDYINVSSNIDISLNTIYKKIKENNLI